MTLNCDLIYDLDPWISRSNFEKVVIQQGMPDWHGTKGMWVNRMLDPHCDFQLWSHPWPCTWIFKVNFYPRPVMAFGCCRCLRVCVRVCLSVNHQLVRAITHQLFKLESPNLDQRCKRPWLRSLLLLGTIDLELQGQIELKTQNLPHFELVRAISHHQLKSVFPNFGQKCILALLRSLLNLGWIDLDVLFYF